MFQKIDKWLSRIENFITGSLFIGSLLVLAWNIFMRKIFHSALPWAEEAIRYAIIWVTFIGSSQCAKAGSHVGIDILVELLPARVQKYVNVLSALLSALFCLFCAVYGVQLTSLVISNHRVSPAMQMPMWVLYVSIPLGFGLTAIRFILIAISKLRGQDSQASGFTDESGNLDISKM